MNWGWQKEYQAALRERNRLAAAQKIMIRRLQELAGADEEAPEVRALREALDSLYGASRQTQFHPEFADDEQHHAGAPRWMRVGGGVCAALMLAFAAAWMIQKRTELNELQKHRAVEAAQINSGPSRIAEPLDEPLDGPTEAASVNSTDGHAANPSGNQLGPSALGATTPSKNTSADRNANTNKLGKTKVEGPAGAIFTGATAVKNPAQTPANDQSESANAAGASSDRTTQTQPITAPPTEPQELIQNPPSSLVDTQEPEKKTDEKPPSKPSEPPASQQAPEIRQDQSQQGEIKARQGSVSVEMGGYPSIRVPPALKQEAARSGASLQIGDPVSRVAPVYPEEAERQGIEGTVKLRAVIDKDGAVENLEIVNGPSLLATAAANAIRQWRYRPTLLGDEPVEVAEEIRVVFRITNASAPTN